MPTCHLHVSSSDCSLGFTGLSDSALQEEAGEEECPGRKEWGSWAQRSHICIAASEQRPSGWQCFSGGSSCVQRRLGALPARQSNTPRGQAWPGHACSQSSCPAHCGRPFVWLDLFRPRCCSRQGLSCCCKVDKSLTVIRYMLLRKGQGMGGQSWRHKPTAGGADLEHGTLQLNEVKAPVHAGG